MKIVFYNVKDRMILTVDPPATIMVVRNLPASKNFQSD